MFKRIFGLAILIGLCALTTGSAQIDFNASPGEQSFRDGVLRFHEGLYGESVLFFQKALENSPADKVFRTWLGRAYYHAGFEDAALREWQTVEGLGGAGLALVSFMEYLKAKQGMGLALDEDQSFLPIHEVKNEAAVPFFRRPSSLITLPTGSTLVSSFASNAISQMDANGRMVKILRVGPQRLQGPFDLCLVGNNRLFVSQFLSDQIYEMNLEGLVVRTWGKKGIGKGEFLGPQYLAWDGGAFIYVSDIGNRRVQKFDLEGNYILSLGERSQNFDGMERPTGILYTDGRLLVLDQRKKLPPRLLVFDDSGNLVDFWEDQRLSGAEGISAFGPGQYLIAAKDSVLLYDSTQQTIQNLHESSRARARYTKTIPDTNGNILAADFDGERLDILSRLAGAYSGLHVQIQRIYTAKFPDIRVDISIADNTGRPIVGLDESNFTLTEGLRPLAGKLVAAGYRADTVDAMVLVEAGLAMASPLNQEALSNMVADLHKELGPKARLGMVSAGSDPVLEASLGSSLKQLQDVLPTLPSDPDWAFDKGIRLSVPELIKAQGLRNLLYVTTGPLPDMAFASYGLQETLSYLRNNRIRFSVLNLGSDPIDPALEYLMKETSGSYVELYQAKGIAGFGKQLFDAKDGSYSFTYRSSFDSDYGRKYLPLEVETRLFQKSGRDEAGFFAPATF